MAEVAAVAAQIVKRNRVRNCHLMPCHSAEMVDPPRVDVVVSETLGNYALEENIIETLSDAVRRHLKPGGVVIPSRLRQCIAPVVAPRIDAELRQWEGAGDDLGLKLDFDVARDMSLNNVYVRMIAPVELLGGGASVRVWDEVDFAAEPSSTRKGEAMWKVAGPATVYGFAVWWEADLGHGITLSTAPDAPPTHWEQLYFPLLKPIVLAAGEGVRVTLQSRSSMEEGTHLSWKAAHLDMSGRVVARQALDLDKGYLP